MHIGGDILAATAARSWIMCLVPLGPSLDAVLIDVLLAAQQPAVEVHEVSSLS